MNLQERADLHFTSVRRKAVLGRLRNHLQRGSNQGDETVAGAREPAAGEHLGREKPLETRSVLTLGFGPDREVRSLTLEVHQLLGRDRRRRSYEFLIPSWTDGSVCGTIDPDGGRHCCNGFVWSQEASGADSGPPDARCGVVRLEPESDERPYSMNGRERDPGRPEPDLGDSQAEHGVTDPTEDGRRARGRRGQGSERDLASWVNWQSALYAFVLGLLSVFLVPLTSFWWIVPVLGVAVPVVLVLLGGRERALMRLEDKRAREGELLRALAEQAELTPAAAAIRTSLTVDEASEMLEDLARKGHLRSLPGGGVVSYSLVEPSRAPSPDETRALTREAEERGAPGGGVAPGPEEPLSERELEVLALLASGRTNAEIARDLFVALGTVKSHVNNIYRKLGAANRAEAVTRAREMRLLH